LRVEASGVVECHVIAAAAVVVVVVVVAEVTL